MVRIYSELRSLFAGSKTGESSTEIAITSATYTALDLILDEVEIDM